MSAAAGLGSVEKIFIEKEAVLIISDGPYSSVHFSDKTSAYISYSQPEIKRRFGVELTRVNRKVSAKKSFVNIFDDCVRFGRKKYKYSRRMKKNWISVLVVFMVAALDFWGSGAVTAQTAVNDKIYGCNRGSEVFSPLTNDLSLPAGSIISDFTPPDFGLLRFVNDGTFRRMKYEFVSGADSTGFTYRAKTPTNVFTNYATVSIVGRDLINLGGSYSAIQKLFGCRVLTRGRAVFEPTANYEFEVTNSMTLLPGTEIKAGAVVEIKVKE